MTELQIIQLTGVSSTMSVSAEPVAPGLLITPGLNGLNGDDGFTGDFLITHGPSGRRIGEGGCIPCARKAAGVMASSCVDWTKPMDEVIADPAAAIAAEKAAELMDDCAGPYCAWAGAS